jgi:hypothetical protein
MNERYFHDKEILGSASTLPVYENGVQVGERPLDITLYFDPFDGDALASQIGSLAIPTGADEITWGYQVNTQRTPTYGGEVVQILSMYADKMVIRGTCQNYNEQRKIYEYFRNYVRYVTGAVGGTTRRRQNFLQFRYPARGWSFVIMVVEAPQLIMRTAQAAPEWQITAEVVSENARVAFGQNRVDRWANVLPTVIPPMMRGRSTRAAAAEATVLTPTASSEDIVYSTLELKTDESGGAIKNFKNVVRTAETDPFGDLMEFTTGGRGKIAENFAALMASYATGDLNTMANNPLNDPQRSADEIWAARFGSEVAFVAGGGGGGGGTVDGAPGSGSGLSGVLDPVHVAALAAAGFKSVGITITNELLVDAVKVCFGESSYNTRSINWNLSGKVNSVTYEEFVQTYANVIPKSSSGAENASFDLGLWQINNYWHPNAIRVACGETGLATGSPPAGTDPWKQSVQVNIDKGNHVKMLDDALANARAMGVIYSRNQWESWVAYGKSRYNEADAGAREAVTKYLTDPAKYDGEVLLIQDGELPTGDSIALAKKLLRYHKAGKYIDGNGTQVKQIQRAADGLPVINDAGVAYSLYEKVLRGIVYLIERGLTIETYSLLDRPAGYNNLSPTAYHPRGQAVDISGINGLKIGSGGDQILNLTIKVATLLNRLEGDMFPDQLITFGAEAPGETNRTLAGLCISPEDGRLDADAALKYYYDSVNGHKDHIHVAWGPRRP